MNIIKSTLFAGVMWFASTPQALCAEVKGLNDTSHIKNYLNEGVKNGLSGAVLIAQKGEILINQGYGQADKERNIPNSPDTVFTVGSVTKQFTAAAIMKLVEQDKLETSDTMERFFSHLPKDKRSITIHQLLTHSSGLIDVVGKGDFDLTQTEVFFERLFATQLINTPGSKYAYSNAGYSVLAKIIELVSGQEYEHFLNAHLFKPAGMNQTGYFIPKWDTQKLAHGYEQNVFHVGSMMDRFQNDGKVSWSLKGNGGIHSTSNDMFKWYQALKSEKVLPKQLIQKMTTPYILEFEGHDSYYGYGWVIYTSDRNTPIVSHNGGNSIFFHDFIWMPEEDVIIIYFTNTSSREVEIAWSIEKLFFKPNHKIEPIKKNPFLYLMDFIASNPAEHSSQLLTELTKRYPGQLENSHLLNKMGYAVLDQGKAPNWAVELFKLNTTLFPDESNVWDSLGDGFKNKGNNEKAILAYKRALKINPDMAASLASLRELGVVVKPETKVANLDHKFLKKYVGQYQIKPGFHITVTIKSGQLFAQPTGRNPMAAIVKSETKFFLKDVGAHIEFNQNPEGVVDSLTLIDGADQVRAERL